MVKKKYQLVWTKRSQQHMKALSKYISETPGIMQKSYRRYHSGYREINYRPRIL